MRSFEALPEEINSFIAATGAACMGTVASSTRTTASEDSMRLVSELDIAAIDFGVWPRPSPSSKTSFGCRPSFQLGTKGPETRTPFTSGVSNRPNCDAWLPAKRVTALMNASLSSVCQDQDSGHPCLFL